MTYQLEDAALARSIGRVDTLQTMRGECILLRALIEERLNLAKTDEQKAAAFPVIHQAMATLQKLVESCQRLEQEASITLSKAAAAKLAQSIGAIIAEEVGDHAALDRISARIAGAIWEARNE